MWGNTESRDIIRESESTESKFFRKSAAGKKATRLLPASPGAGGRAFGEPGWGRFNYSFEVRQELARAVLGPC